MTGRKTPTYLLTVTVRAKFTVVCWHSFSLCCIHSAIGLCCIHSAIGLCGIHSVVGLCCIHSVGRCCIHSVIGLCCIHSVIGLCCIHSTVIGLCCIHSVIGLCCSHSVIGLCCSHLTVIGLCCIHSVIGLCYDAETERAWTMVESQQPRSRDPRPDLAPHLARAAQCGVVERKRGVGGGTGCSLLSPSLPSLSFVFRSVA